MTARPPVFGSNKSTRSRYAHAPKKPRVSFRARGYGRDWEAIRGRVLAEEPTCQWPGCNSPSTICDHILALKWCTRTAPNARANLQGLCEQHHRRKTLEENDALARARPRDLPPVLGPLIVVSGSPGSGKSTFARDLVGTRTIDLDEIKSALSGAPIHVVDEQWTAAAFCVRNHVLRKLACKKFDEPVALVIGAPTAAEREKWSSMLSARGVCVLLTPADESVRRIRMDVRRAHCVEDHVRYVHRWWATHSLARADLIVTPAARASALAKAQSLLR